MTAPTLNYSPTVSKYNTALGALAAVLFTVFASVTLTMISAAVIHLISLYPVATPDPRDARFSSYPEVLRNGLDNSFRNELIKGYIAYAASILVLIPCVWFFSKMLGQIYHQQRRGAIAAVGCFGFAVALRILLFCLPPVTTTYWIFSSSWCNYATAISFVGLLITSICIISRNRPIPDGYFTAPDVNIRRFIQAVILLSPTSIALYFITSFLLPFVIENQYAYLSDLSLSPSFSLYPSPAMEPFIEILSYWARTGLGIFQPLVGTLVLALPILIWRLIRPTEQPRSRRASILLAIIPFVVIVLPVLGILIAPIFAATR